MAGYKGVKEHGFIALSSVKDDKSADAIFKKIDGNGGGVIMLEEWCDFLKAAEIETFILQTLMTAFPKDSKQKDHRGDPLERGRDLFDAFRPCYIR